MSNLNALVVRCLECIQSASCPSAELVSQLHGLARYLYCNEVAISKSLIFNCQDMIAGLLSLVCVAFSSESDNSHSKPLYEVFKDAVICTLSKLSNISLDFSYTMVLACLSHIDVCESCNDTFILLNSICSLSKNACLAFQSPLLYNKLIDILSSCCSPSNNRLNVLYYKIKEDSYRFNSVAKTNSESFFHAKQNNDELLEHSNEEVRKRIKKNTNASRSVRRRLNRATASGEDLSISQNASVNISSQPSVPRLNINQILSTDQLRSRMKSASTRSTPYSSAFSTSFDRAQNKNRIGNIKQTQVRSIKQLNDVNSNPSFLHKKDISVIDGDTFYINQEPIAGTHSNASAKLKTLAIQLGECCMATDLAALMSQRRSCVHCEELKQQFTAAEPSDEFMNDINALIFSLVAKVINEMTTEALITSLAPWNALFVYQSSQEFQEFRERTLPKMMEMGEYLYACECSRSFKSAIINKQLKEEKVITSDEFDSLWNRIESVIGYSLANVTSEWISLKSILHKHAMIVESVHFRLSKLTSTSTTDQHDEIRTEKLNASLTEDMEYGNLSAQGYLALNGIHSNMHEKRQLEIVRRQIDCYFLRIVRGIQLGISNLKSISSESAITMLQQQLVLLADYISSASNRIVIQQSIDYLMEDLLKIKAKLIDFSLSCNAIRIHEMHELLAKEEGQGLLYLHKNSAEFPTLTQAQRILWQKLFVQYLNVIGLIISYSEDMSLIKLLNEAFIASELWQDLTIALILQLFTGSAYSDQEFRMIIFNDLSHETEYAIRSTISEAAQVMKYYIAISHVMLTIIRLENLNKRTPEETDSQRYWRKTICRTLKSISYILRPPDGILVKCLSLGTAPYVITKGVLELISHLFQFGPRFSEYFNEEWSLFYIRTHYLNFIRLYNKDMASADEKERKEATELCKYHMRCLLVIAKNRNKETSRNFYKLRCVEFLTREIDFEYNSCVFEKQHIQEDSQQPYDSMQRTPSFELKPKFFGKEIKYDPKAEKKELKIDLMKMSYCTESDPSPPNEIKIDTDKQASKTDIKSEIATSKEESTRKANCVVEEVAITIPLTKDETSHYKPRVPPLKIDGLSNKKNEPYSKGELPPSKTKSSVKNDGLSSHSSRIVKPEDSQGISIIPKAVKRNLLANVKNPSDRSVQPNDTESSRLNESHKRIQSQVSAVKPKVAFNFRKQESKPSPEIPKVDKTNPEIKKEILEYARPASAYVAPSPKLGEKGTYVGSNKVWVPHLNFPRDIDNYKEESEVAIKIERPNEDRFKLKRFAKAELNKTLNQPTLEKSIELPKPGRKGLLDISCCSIIAGPKKDPNALAPPKVEQKEAKKVQYNNPPDEEAIVENKRVKVPLLKLSVLNKKNAEQTYKERKEEEYAVALKGDNCEGKLSALETALLVSKNKWQLIRENTNKNLNNTNKNTVVNESSEANLSKARLDRNIYSDPELHAMMIGLLFALLLKPPRGVLDELYCSANPLDEGKQNVLYLLHFHLNNPLNQEILPLLFKFINELRPPLAGQRLLKLLCKHFFDISAYSNQKKIATGAFGTVFEYYTNLSDPSVVAIKQLNFPNNIYGRCVLYDIFNEIAALQELRAEQCASTLHDYGVDCNNYYIVMKRYTCSLRDWRLRQTGSITDNLYLYLNIFQQVLKAVKVTHLHNVTHYDLKCDNFLLEMKEEDEGAMNVALGDFGECRLFDKEEDEYNLEARGTECIKSPEMLTLTINVKKDCDKYDNRRKVGTTRASDIWSLGCLFYELLTGEYLFATDDYVVFYLRVTSEEEEVLSENKKQVIANNVYLVDFLNALLIRDPMARPNIEKAIERFKHVHALLMNTGINTALRITSFNPQSNSSEHTSLDLLLESYSNIIQTKCKGDAKPALKLKTVPILIRIMKNMYLCSSDYLLKYRTELISDSHITHIIIPKHLYRDELQAYFSILKITTRKGMPDSTMNVYSIIPTILDYLRKVALNRGVLLFIDDCFGQGKNSDEGTIKEILLVTLGYILQISGYETWTLCNSQVLFLSVCRETIARISKWLGLNTRVASLMNGYLKYSCLCGSCTFVLTRHFSDPKGITTKTCSCSPAYGKTAEVSDCPSRGCAEFLAFIKARYRLRWESVKWGYFEKNDFVIGPMGCGTQTNTSYQKLMINSNGSLQNSICHYITEKVQWGDTEGTKKWTLYKCKVCHMWTYAILSNTNKIALVLNNLISTLLLMDVAKRVNPLDDESFNKSAKVPILSNIEFALPL